MTDYAKWFKQLTDLINTMEECGIEASARVLTPVSKKEIDRAEFDLQLQFPKSLRESLLAIRGKLDWARPEGEDELPEEFSLALSGFFEWHVEHIVETELDRRSFFETVIKVPKNSRHQIWLNKLAIFGTEDGDFVALDLALGDDPPVVFLCRDSLDPHGAVLAPTLGEFFREWFGFACVGPSVSAFAVMTDDFKLPLSTKNACAQVWLEWFNDL